MLHGSIAVLGACADSCHYSDRPAAVCFSVGCDTAVIIMVALELFLIGLLIGLWDMVRFEWALQGVAAIIFGTYVAYVVSMLASGPFSSGRRSAPSVLNAVAGFFMWGVPSFRFMLRGIAGFQVR